MGLAFSSAAVAVAPTALALVKAAAPTVASAALAAIARRGSMAPDSTTTALPLSPTTTTTTTVVIELQVKGAPTSVNDEAERTTAIPISPTVVARVATTVAPPAAPTLEVERKNEGLQSIPDSLHFFVSDLTGSDVVSDGSLQSPFQTLERALNEIRERGYHTSAKITILDQVQLSAHTLDTCVTGKGAQERPLVLSTRQNSIVVPL